MPSIHVYERFINPHQSQYSNTLFEQKENKLPSQKNLSKNVAKSSIFDKASLNKKIESLKEINRTIEQNIVNGRHSQLRENKFLN